MDGKRQPLFQVPIANICCADWIARDVRIHNIKLSLFSLEGHSISGDWQRRCNTNWHYHHLRSLSLRLGHWQWKRQSSRKLTLIRLHCSMPLSDLHRLSTLLPCRATTTTIPSCRFSSFPSYYHGILHDPLVCTISVTFYDSCCIQLHHSSVKYHNSFGHYLSRLPTFRPIRLDSDYSSSPRIWSPSFVSRSISRGLRWRRSNPWVP